jgi:hypothetical protein
MKKPIAGAANREPALCLGLWAAGNARPRHPVPNRPADGHVGRLNDQTAGEGFGACEASLSRMSRSERRRLLASVERRADPLSRRYLDPAIDNISN